MKETTKISTISSQERAKIHVWNINQIPTPRIEKANKKKICKGRCARSPSVSYTASASVSIHKRIYFARWKKINKKHTTLEKRSFIFFRREGGRDMTNVCVCMFHEELYTFYPLSVTYLGKWRKGSDHRFGRQWHVCRGWIHLHCTNIGLSFVPVMVLLCLFIWSLQLSFVIGRM